MLAGQGGGLQKKRTEQTRRRLQQPLARSSQPLARHGSRNRTFIQLNSNCGGARPRKMSPKQSPTSTMFPPLASQRVAKKRPNSQIQARQTPEVVKKSWQPLARKLAGVAQKRKAPLLTPAGRGQLRRRVFDGSVSEEQHLEDHSGFKGFCIRCDMQKRRKVYEACAWHAGGSWLATGVRNGLWGLGCTECASFLASGRQLPGSARFSKFATFQFRPRQNYTKSYQIIERHTKSESHRLACGLNRKRTDMSDVPSRPQPLPCPEIMCQAKASDQALPASSPPNLWRGSGVFWRSRPRDQGESQG